MCWCLRPAGYPFDVPPPGAGLLTHCMLAYHLPLLIAFSTRCPCDMLSRINSITLAGLSAEVMLCTPAWCLLCCCDAPLKLLMPGCGPLYSMCSQADDGESPHQSLSIQDCPCAGSARALCGAAACCSRQKRCGPARMAFCRHTSPVDILSALYEPPPCLVAKAAAPGPVVAGVSWCCGVPAACTSIGIVCSMDKYVLRTCHHEARARCSDSFCCTILIRRGPMAVTRTT